MSCRPCGNCVIALCDDDLRFHFVRAQQWPPSIENVLQPRTSELGRNHSDKHESRVELGVDDPGVEGDAGYDDAGTTTCIGRERKIDEVKPAEASEPTCK
jgi:hypothetical protein